MFGTEAEMLISPELAAQLESVRRRADELEMPLETALKQAFLMYLQDVQLPAVIRTHCGQDGFQGG
jgi:hypothetical protein